MYFRVTNQTQTANATSYIQQRGTNLAKFQDQVSSGLRVKVASDDPNAFPAISQAKAASQRLAAYAGNVADSTSVLNAGVSALQDVNDVLVRARQIAIEGADSTTGSDPTSRESLAIELDGLITQSLQIANSQPDGKAVFGGTAIDSPPFRVATLDANGRPATIAYDGAAERTRSLIGVGQTVDTRYAGNTVFQQPGADVFQSLIALRDDLRNPAFNDSARSQALNTRLTELTAARDAIGDVMGEKSSNLANLESLGNLLTDLKLTADIRTGELAGTDYADAVVKMQEQESALQAIYAVSAKLLEPSLLDFIR